ncbi:MAG: SixA phosphatase family protein [Flavobacterium sp.]|uniref:SixA phosphatase family protein n=1 Tax=Flavobacterium TaxID=237 RepID=UPI00391B6B05
MKQLFIIRHAKSSWSTPLNDVDRPLTNRGIHDAHLVSLQVKDELPDSYLVWSSVAKRAAETATIFAQNLLFPTESIQFKKELYTFDDRRLEQIIKSCPDSCHHLIVFGHNEAITNFVNKFGNIFIDNVPTSGFVKLSFNVTRWNDIAKGHTHKTVFPKELK